MRADFLSSAEDSSSREASKGKDSFETPLLQFCKPSMRILNCEREDLQLTLVNDLEELAVGMIGQSIN